MRDSNKSLKQRKYSILSRALQMRCIPTFLKLNDCSLSSKRFAHESAIDAGEE